MYRSSEPWLLTIAIAIMIAATLVGCRSAPDSKPFAAAPPTLAGAPIVLVTIDTLRADRLGAYGSNRGLTPVLDRFGQDAVRFTAAIAQVPLTVASHATILTGAHPRRHGVRTNDGFTLPADVPTVAESLRHIGYRTAAFVGGYPLQRSAGLSKGFDHYDDAFLRESSGVIERRGEDVVRAAVSWIEQNTSPQGAGQPFFAWLHLFDPHSPYEAPPAFRSAHPQDPYDAEIAYTDAAIGHLFERLRELKLFDRTISIVVADHGESLGEHGERTHGMFVYDSTIRVPLLIRLPGRRPQTITTPVETADIAPTLASAVGASLPPTDGQNLLPLFDGATADPERATYAESYYQAVLLGWSPLRTVRTARWKYIEAPRAELYDLETDPEERDNRIEQRAALANGLRASLSADASHLRPQGAADSGDGGQAPRAAPLTSEAAERLRSLGYLSGATQPTPASLLIDPKDRTAVWTELEDGIDHITRNPVTAADRFTRALQLDPMNGLAMKYLADLSFRAGRLKEAHDGYQRALAAGFRHPDVYINLSSIAERQGRREAARAALAEAVTIAPQDADAWNRLGQLEAERGVLDAARAAFTRAAEASPDRAEPLYNLGLVERRAGNEPVAHAHLREAIARNPRYAEAHYELATGLLAARRPQDALDEYRTALTIQPDYPEALFGAARAALDLGRHDEARRDYERFIAVAPSAYRRQIDAAREALRQLTVRHRQQ